MSPLRIASAALLAGVTLAMPTHDAAAQPAKPTILITLNSHFYNPNPIILPGGVPVHLVLENKSGKTHDFTAPEFFRSAHIQSGNAPNGSINLQKGQSTTIDLIAARGTYKVHCTQPFHTMLGMTGKIIVS
jgi:uncharacterized cupredoxin-like copper-binding protein